MGHADVMKLLLCCLGCWGDMAPRSSQLRICAGAQEGSLGKQTNLPISTDWELGALLVHTYEGRAVLWGQGEINGHHGALHSPAEPCQIHTEPVFSPQRSLYVGAASGIVQVPLASCARYASCYDCILARDPYCAWDGRACRTIATTDR